jgi:hypothetical protein
MKARIKMKRETVKLLAMVALGSFLAAGCQTGGGSQKAGASAASEAAVVSEAPPPPRVEPITTPPGGRLAWVAGYWKRSESLWVWVPGGWQQPPFSGAVWSAGHWDKVEKGWVWTPGRWN